MAIQIHITFKSKEEKKEIARYAKNSGLSISNYFRKCAGLEPLAHGGKRKRKKPSLAKAGVCFSCKEAIPNSEGNICAVCAHHAAQFD